MFKPDKSAIDIIHEVNRLRIMLCLPVTHIHFDLLSMPETPTAENPFPMENAELFINDTMIGAISFFISSANQVMYNMQNALNWEKVYAECKQDIFPKIASAEPNAHSAEPNKYKNLDVRNSNGELINRAYCNFVNNKWEVVVVGLNVIEAKKITTITLTPPPPIL